MDMDAFFASIEQREDPSLMGHPVAITNGQHGRMLITCSYEARAYGLYTTMPVWEAKQRCPTLIVLPSRLSYYTEVSNQMIAFIQQVISPEVDVFSIDEMFIRLSLVGFDAGLPEIISMLHRKIYRAFKLPISMGVAHNKTNAKYATQLNKPMGISIIPPREAAAFLANLPVDVICGIGKGLKRMFAKHGIHTCGQVKQLPISILSKRFGTPGRILWHQCQGEDITPFIMNNKPQKTVSSSKVMPPNVTSSDDALFFLAFIAHELASKLVVLKKKAVRYQMTLVFDRKYARQKMEVPGVPTQSCLTLLASLKVFFKEALISHRSLSYISIESDRLSDDQQGHLLAGQQNESVQQVLSVINKVFGKQAIVSARLIPNQHQQVASKDLKRR